MINETLNYIEYRMCLAKVDNYLEKELQPIKTLYSRFFIFCINTNITLKNCILFPKGMVYLVFKDI